MNDHRDHRSGYNREDPRLSRKRSKSPERDPRNRSMSNSGNNPATDWPPAPTPTAPVVTTAHYQTSYQHLMQPQPVQPVYPTPYPPHPHYQGYPGYPPYGTAYPGYPPYQTAHPETQYPQPAEYPPPQNWPPPTTTQAHGAPQVYATAATSAKIIADTAKKNDGVAKELKQQKTEIMKQREDYERRVSILRREFELLKRQKHELQGDNDRETTAILKENGKLQLEVQTKLKDAYNVIDLLSGVIGDKDKYRLPGERRRHNSRSRSPQGGRESESGGAGGSVIGNPDLPADVAKYNYVHYDPELHWCRICDVFPKTAKDLLTHLHDGEHRQLMQEENVEIPWHKLPPEAEFPYTEGAAKKRVPIKGIQFFISAPAWYCRLCDTWIGDLHCASQHLKSVAHCNNYANFVDQNPHWEMEWLKDREKALERVKKSGGPTTHTPPPNTMDLKSRKRSSSPRNRDKKKKRKAKKKKRSSSSTSSSSTSSSDSSEDEDKSKSIRVAMRNKMESKLDIINKIMEEKRRIADERDASAEKIASQPKPPEDPLIIEWMTVSKPAEKDKYLFDSLKDRLKQKQDAEKSRAAAEADAKRKQALEEERKQKEKKERELKEQREREDRERRERELGYLNREQVKFKPVRKRSSRSVSPERIRNTRNNTKRSRSRSPRGGAGGSIRSTDRNGSGRKNSSQPKERVTEPKEESVPKSSTVAAAMNKRLPFIGRMPLFKNKKPEEKVKVKEVEKEEYDLPRRSRFQPGGILTKAFLPQPDVVHYPKLSCYPPPAPPEAPTISVPQPPPAPKIADKAATAAGNSKKQPVLDMELPPPPAAVTAPPPPPPPPPPPLPAEEDGEGQQASQQQDSVASAPEAAYNYSEDDYYQMYGDQTNGYDYNHEDGYEVPTDMLEGKMESEDPNAELAMLGICTDDMAAQSF